MMKEISDHIMLIIYSVLIVWNNNMLIFVIVWNMWM